MLWVITIQKKRYSFLVHRTKEPLIFHTNSFLNSLHSSSRQKQKTNFINNLFTVHNGVEEVSLVDESDVRMVSGENNEKAMKVTSLQDQSFKSKLKEVKPFDNGNFLLNPFEYISSCTVLMHYYNLHVLKGNLGTTITSNQSINVLKQMHPLCTFNLFLYLHEDGNLYLFEGDSPADVYFSSSGSNGDDTLKRNNLFSDVQTGKPLIIPSPIWSTNIQVKIDNDKVIRSETNEYEKQAKENSKYNTFASFDSATKIFRIYQVKKYSQNPFLREENFIEKSLILWEKNWYRLPRLYMTWLLPETYHHLGTSIIMNQKESSSEPAVHIHQFDKFRVAYSKGRLCLLPYSYQLLSPVKDSLLPEYVFFIHVPTLISNTREKIIVPFVLPALIELNLWLGTNNRIKKIQMQMSILKRKATQIYTKLDKRLPQGKIYKSTIKSCKKIVRQIIQDIDFENIVKEKQHQTKQLLIKMKNKSNNLYQSIKKKEVLGKARHFLKKRINMMSK